MDNETHVSDGAAALSDELSPDTTSKRARVRDQREGSAEDSQEDFLRRRKEGVWKVFHAGRDRNRSLQERVKASRAGCIAEVLFAENGAADLKLHPGLRLPTRQQAEHLLDTYKEDVQCVSNILIIDLNRARINSFLDWWHSNPVEMPIEADAPLAPLVLVVLALSLQAKRARDSITNPTIAQRTGHNNFEPVYPWISSERYLLETAGRCINALQIVCPSSWAAAYSAPLDVVRAEALRGLWHLGECHLQFAASCFSVALRLAYAAGLHRDPDHWTAAQMGKFEAQARRSAWWNIVTLEVFHAMRLGQPSTVLPEEMDTQLPLDFAAIAEQYEITRDPHGPPSRLAFDAITTRFRLAKYIVTRSRGLSIPQGSAPRNHIGEYDELYDGWISEIPESLRSQMQDTSSAHAWQLAPRDGRWELITLQMNYLQGCIATNNSKKESDTTKSPSATKAYLQAASHIAALCYKGIMQRPHIPAAMLGTFVYYLFNTGCLLAIQTVSPAPMISICQPPLEQALSALDSLGNIFSLHNVSELAAKYAGVIRDIRRKGFNPQSGGITWPCNVQKFQGRSGSAVSTDRKRGSSGFSTHQAADGQFRQVRHRQIAPIPPDGPSSRRPSDNDLQIGHQPHHWSSSDTSGGSPANPLSEIAGASASSNGANPYAHSMGGHETNAGMNHGQFDASSAPSYRLTTPPTYSTTMNVAPPKYQSHPTSLADRPIPGSSQVLPAFLSALLPDEPPLNHTNGIGPGFSAEETTVQGGWPNTLLHENTGKTLGGMPEDHESKAAAHPFQPSGQASSMFGFRKDATSSVGGASDPSLPYVPAATPRQTQNIFHGLPGPRQSGFRDVNLPPTGPADSYTSSSPVDVGAALAASDISGGHSDAGSQQQSNFLQQPGNWHSWDSYIGSLLHDEREAFFY